MTRDSARCAATTTALVVVCLVALFACGSPDHTDKARSVFEDSDFGQPYRVAATNEDPAIPGSYGVDLAFQRPVDLDAIRPPDGFDATCGATCDARYFDGPEAGADGERCEMFVTSIEGREDVLNVLVSCGPAYGDP